MEPYDHKKIEQKWQVEWEKKKIYNVAFPSQKPKYYCLVEFPYPSGDGLHTGHVRSYTALDVVARKRRREGYNVLYPIGWDAFGLPTENFAIKTKTPPEEVTKTNTDTFRRQLKSLGLSFDWSREINTTDPSYYKWTQWIFLQFLKKGLAYKKKSLINWCPNCKIGLANEEAVGGKCERCGGTTEKREKEQWMLAITKYADRLDKDLDLVDYPERVKLQQRNWIGKSEGVRITFNLVDISGQKDGTHSVEVFTTRPDTIFGATFLAISPELAKKWIDIGWSVEGKVEKYVNEILKKRVEETYKDNPEKTGVFSGINAINPANQEKIPVWIVNYVLGDVGTGAIMAVPAHDERDFEFAIKYKLPIRHVVMPSVVDHVNPPEKDKSTKTRTTVHAIVYDKKRKAYLTLTSKKFHWNTTIIGGVEEGEDLIQAALREVVEETGYTDITFKRILGGPIKASYFARHKNENRVAITQGVYFELESEKSIPRSKEEIEANDVVWTNPKDFVPGKMVNSELPFWLERLRGEDKGAYSGEGILIESGEFSGLLSEEAKKKITEYIKGKPETTYKLRDWVFSRQRYWGEPIPVIICDTCGFVPVPESDLPIVLPKVKAYTPSDTGESPLSKIEEWVNVSCPQCGGKAKRETDTMPQWAGSSWYYLRYTDTSNDIALASNDALKYFIPVDWYNGGMEHTTLHLLYSRFWHKFLYDLGVTHETEPYKKRTSHGMILASDGKKMSKSKGNVINPDAIVEMFGADTLRLYELFIGPFTQEVTWSEESIVGPRRFLERVWKLASKVEGNDNEELQNRLQKTIKKVSEDIESTAFNTVVSELMITLNEMEKEKTVPQNVFETFLLLLAPLAPHISEELWQNLGHQQSIHETPWPTYTTLSQANKEMTIVIQINGKVRGSLKISSEMPKGDVEKEALKTDVVNKWLVGATPKRIIYIEGKLINIVG